MVIIYNARPLPASRPRVTLRGTYNDPKYTNWKKGLALVAKTICKKPLENAVIIRVDFFYRPPKSWSEKKIKETPYHTSKPDLDNLLKSVLDGLNKIAYKDDAQVFSVCATKQYSKEDKVVIQIEEIK